MTTQNIQFIRRGELVTLANVAPDRTLLEVLREGLVCSGTKEGCGEGDCGACTVVVGEPSASGKGIDYRAINSCIRMAHSIDGMALWTVEDIAEHEGGDTTLHPAQQAMVDCHGSQCGFCTPGFVMSMFGMYQNHVCKGRSISRELAQEELSGNLCRCTGYRPIFDAAQRMESLPAVKIDEKALLSQLKAIRKSNDSTYLAPESLGELLTARSQNPDAQIVAGTTDVGLWITKMHMRFPKVLDVTRAREIRRIENYPNHIAIGAAVSLSDAYAALVKDRPQLKEFSKRFAGLPVRNSGTLGGNVANGSPIGDSMPLLIALGANVVLMSARGHREMPLEKMYLGYRKSVMAADEIVAWIKIPKPARTKPAEFTRVYKISKRFDDDISAVCLALQVRIDASVVTHASIGAGGVAATPVRASKTQAFLEGRKWNLETVRAAAACIREEFSPISDMRASAAYRREVLGNLIERFWLESQGMTQINLESFVVEEQV